MPLYANDLRVGNAVLSGAANRVLFEDASQNLSVAPELTYDSSNGWLGIGTTPTNRLHVSGTDLEYLVKLKGPSDGGFETYAALAVYNSADALMFTAGGGGVETATDDYGYFGVKGHPTSPDGICGDLTWSNVQAVSSDKRVATFRILRGSDDTDSYGYILLRDSVAGFVDVFRFHHSGRVGVNMDQYGNNPAGTMHAYSRAATDPIIIAQNAASQSANSFEQRDNAGSVQTVIQADGSLKVFGSFSVALRTTTSNITLESDDHTCLADATAGNVVITIPDASLNTNKIYVVKKKDTSANTVTVQRSGADLIDGATSYVLVGAQRPSIAIQSDGTGWWIL